MKLAPGIRKHGYRKWYERELMRSHAHMLLTLFCLLGGLAAFEAATHFRSRIDQLIDYAAAAVCLITGFWATRKYLYLLLHAESVANQADCPSCATYGRFRLEGADVLGNQARVCCRNCDHRWTIHG